MKRILKLGQKGVTLVEMLIVMGLLSIFLLIITTIFTSTLDVQNQTDAYSAVLSDGRFIMARINYDIAISTTITTPTTLGVTSSSLVLTTATNSYTYALNGGNLQLTDNTGSANLNSSGTVVSNLSFTKLGNTGGKNTTRYTFTLTSTSKHSGTTDSQTFTSTAGRR
jgi:prepilin-type N-terminal cleavage/methylation domain-containing protein